MRTPIPVTGRRWLNVIPPLSLRSRPYNKLRDWQPDAQAQSLA